MHGSVPPLNALRAFEAAARHLSLTKAALELHVTAGALSHQIRGLEELLGLKLFERGVRSIALTREGQLLLPGLQTGFGHIRDAVAALRDRGDTRVLVVSTPPGFTSKWLAPRLYRFSAEHPGIDVRVSSSTSFANFKTDGVDVALRVMPVNAPPDPDLAIEKLIDVCVMPVCSPTLIGAQGAITTAHALKLMPLIHDEGLTVMPGWADWFKAAGIDGVNLDRGLRFNSADHALDAVIEGAGVLLAYDVLAYDDLRTGRLVAPSEMRLRSNRAYHVVCARSRQSLPNVKAFTDWIKREIFAMDWGTRPDRFRAGKTGERKPGKSAAKRRR